MPEDAEVFVGDLFSPKIYDITSIFDHLIEKFKSEDEGNGIQDCETVSWYKEFWYHAKRQELVLRTYLKKSDEWIECIKSECSYEEYSENLDKTPFPEYVWVVELSWPFIFQHGRKLCGVVIVDPTDEITPAVEMLLQGWLWMHVPGIVMHRNAKTNEVESKILTGRDSIAEHYFTCKNIGQ
jgi:hypothetical protein